jgi:hypothetical protein
VGIGWGIMPFWFSIASAFVLTSDFLRMCTCGVSIDMEWDFDYLKTENPHRDKKIDFLMCGGCKKSAQGHRKKRKSIESL